MSKALIATADAFLASGKFVARGEVIQSSEVPDYKEGDTNGFIPAPSGVTGNAVVEVSAIAPSGPNPKNPQQVAPGTVQTAGGYVQDGATLVGEVTIPAKERLVISGITDTDDNTQSLVAEALADAAKPAKKAAAAKAADDK